MPKRSAGLLLYRMSGRGRDVLLVHPGGPYWARRDAGAWSIPKGEYGADEDPFEAAKREFAEETGASPPSGEVLDLGEAVQKSRKVVRAFALRGDFDVATLLSNLVEIEFPPRSGRRLQVPEVDRAEWCDDSMARTRILAGQAIFLDRLDAALR